jgi:hypothetical protein
MPVIGNELLALLRQLRAIGEISFPTRSEEGARPRLPFTPGTEVLATVMEKLENGRSVVRIATELFDMDLPARFRPGDSLKLTFLGQDPRPAFSLARETVSATPITLSPTGKLLGELLREQPAGTVAEKSSLPVPDRLMDGPPTDTARLAERIRQTVSESGRFYESHLKEWSQGERTIGQILQEPQATLSSPAGVPEAEPHELHERPKAEAVPALRPGEIAAPQTLPLVRQQLQQLTTGAFLWQGEAWQGQPLEWEVTEREADPGEAEGKGWETTLRLDLPNLGRVTGVVRLAGKVLRLDLETASSDSASLLAAQTGDLEGRLSASGMEVKGVTIRHEEREGA